MDILTALSPKSDYTTSELQWILGAWVLSDVLERRRKVQSNNGHVSEEDYTKQSIYSLLYSLYRSMGDVASDVGTP